MDQTFYNGLWTTLWGDQQSLGPVHRHLQKLLVPIVAALKVRSLLEVGCGSGDNLSALSRYGYEMTGSDIAPEALELARQRVPQARLILLDIEKEVLSEQFDLVMSLQVLEHILDDKAALRHIAGMSKGYVLISTMRGRMRPYEIAIGHLRNYSILELQRKMEVAGLEVVKLWGWGFPFFSPLYRTLTEWLPGGPPQGPMGKWQRVMARALYQLYRLNWPGRGDVLYALAKIRRPETEENGPKPE